jgi:putative membrane protein
MQKMNYMFEAGFLGTNAPFFMDFVTLIVAFLPMLIYFAIVLARKKLYKTHAVMQNFIYIFSVVVVSYFEYGVRLGGGFDGFMSESHVAYNYALWVLVVHVIIATITLFYWSKTIIKANYQMSKRMIPGIKSREHRLLAFKSYLGIIFTSFTGIWVYILLFIY